jgi:glyceraldehyde-3-phosphate dehydrogenase/erythrose-4-phosphate dehydrogenase
MEPQEAAVVAHVTAVLVSLAVLAVAVPAATTSVLRVLVRAAKETTAEPVELRVVQETAAVVVAALQLATPERLAEPPEQVAREVFISGPLLAVVVPAVALHT